MVLTEWLSTFSQVKTSTQDVRPSSVDIDDEVRKDLSPLGVELIGEFFDEFSKDGCVYKMQRDKPTTSA